MRVLIVGSDTPVGRALQDFLRRRGRHVEILSSRDCRWKSERQAKKALVRADCELVVDTRVQAAADGGVRIHDMDLSRTLWLSKSCHKNKMVYVYLSTARIYSGDLGRPYNEDEAGDNQESLGTLLIASEASVRKHCERHLILRLGPVFSHRGVNVLTHMLAQLKEGGTLVQGDRLEGCPVASEDAARVVSAILDQLSTGAQTWGNYHYCSSEPTNCYEFAEVLLASASQFSELSGSAVVLAPSEETFPRRDRSLDCSSVRNTFAIKQNAWRGYVADTVKNYFQTFDKAE